MQPGTASVAAQGHTCGSTWWSTHRWRGCISLNLETAEVRDSELPLWRKGTREAKPRAGGEHGSHRGAGVRVTSRGANRGSCGHQGLPATEAFRCQRRKVEVQTPHKTVSHIRGQVGPGSTGDEGSQQGDVVGCNPRQGWQRDRAANSSGCLAQGIGNDVIPLGASSGRTAGHHVDIILQPSATARTGTGSQHAMSRQPIPGSQAASSHSGHPLDNGARRRVDEPSTTHSHPSEDTGAVGPLKRNILGVQQV